LPISQPDDPDEQEADRVADQIMHMREPMVLRQCVTCAAGRPPCAACEEEQIMLLRNAQGETAGDAPVSVHSVLRSPGAPLPASTRAFFEPRIGQDLSHVRVHTDDAAQQSAKDVSALAYTVGSHVVFGAGRYAPHSTAGERLLAHELAHVAQQSGRVVNVAAQVHRTVSGTNCHGGTNSAPVDPAATLTALEERAVGLAQGAAILAAVGSASATMDIDVTNHSVGQAFAARFGLPPVVRGGFQNRFTGHTRPTLNEAVSEELDRLSDRLQSIADLYSGSMSYRCITGATTFAGWDTHCRNRAASACHGVRVIFLCPNFWGITGPERQALLLIHEGAHVRFGNPSHSVSGRLHNFRHPECLASFVADLFGHGTNLPACPAP